MYDPEATIQEADILMAQYASEARQMERQRERGICLHQSAVGYNPNHYYPEQVGLKPGQQRCTDGCGRVFESDEDYFEAIQEAMYS